MSRRHAAEKREVLPAAKYGDRAPTQTGVSRTMSTMAEGCWLRRVVSSMIDLR